MTIRFSEHPGCWERHLQRQYNNPLFSHLSRPLTQADVTAAQRQDQSESINFQQEFQKLLETVASLPAKVSAEESLNLTLRIDRLYEQCAGLGGDYQATAKQGLRQLSLLIKQAILESGINDPARVAELETQQRGREAHFDLLEHPLLADLLHPNSPITEALLVPTLLSETDTTLRVAMNLFNSEQRPRLCQEARQLLTQLQTEGHALPTAWQRLAIMEQS